MTGTAKAGIPMKNTHPARGPSQSALALSVARCPLQVAMRDHDALIVY